MRRVAFLLLCSCTMPGQPSHTTLSVHNAREASAVVFVAFGSDSKITGKDWPFCEGADLSCSFPIDGKGTRHLPSSGYVNATFSFNAPVGCGVTKAEINVNNPSWYDTLDVSLVDGYSDAVEIVATPTGGDAVKMGPPKGQTGNAEVYGLFPYGCDVCVARENPPCGIPKGRDGCKKGGQYDPDVPCQWQGKIKGGGALAVEVALLR